MVSFYKQLVFHVLIFLLTVHHGADSSRDPYLLLPESDQISNGFPTVASVPLRLLIEDRWRAYVHALKTRTVQNVLRFYTKDVTISLPGSERFEGKSRKLEKALEGFFDRQLFLEVNVKSLTELQSDSKGLSHRDKGVGDSALETDEILLRNEKGHVVETGKQIVVWKKVEGQYYIYWLIWNTNQEAPTD